jgi:hypothetical protein
LVLTLFFNFSKELLEVALSKKKNQKEPKPILFFVAIWANKGLTRYLNILTIFVGEILNPPKCPHTTL